MNSGISKKLIVSSFLIISSIQQSRPAEFRQINEMENNQANLISLARTLKNKIITNPFLNNNFQKISVEQNPDQVITDLIAKQDELVIQSDKQSEINNVLFAEGNVSVSYKGKLLQTDKLIYDKLNKKISAEGNITLFFGQQIFKISKLEYNFKNETGYLLDVKGSINSDKLISDLSEKFYDSDFQKLQNLLNFEKKVVLHTPNKVHNWIFSSERINIDGEKWKSNKAIFSNDILQFKQVKIEINSLEVRSLKDELRFRSSLNYLVLDENISIPFWLGNRKLTKAQQNKLDSKASWSLGYDSIDKDGLFIGRKLKSIYLADDFFMGLEPQFLIQRSLNGHTKSFVEDGDSITGEKIERGAVLADYFGIESQIKGKLNSWDLEIDNQINSLDSNKFPDALRLKSLLKKEINFLNTKWDKSFYGVYRDRVWNGSLGEAEIYLGYGSKLEKKHTWEVNGTTSSEVLSLGLSHLKGEALVSKNLAGSLKGNLFYSLDKNIPLSVDKPKNKIIDSSYEYIYEPIKKGLSLNTRIAALYSLYDDGKHQKYIGLGLGPELILGNFKDKTFDYTRFSIFPFYKFKNGESVFKFDQISEKLTLNIGFDQQIFGPIIFESNGTLNLDGDSSDYGKLIDSKILVNWKKRSYEFGIFYQPHNQAGGIAFNLFGFK